MTKKHFIQLANVIKSANAYQIDPLKTFPKQAVEAIAEFCASQNPRLNRERWIGYINGENTANGKPLPACVRGMGTLCAYHASKPNGKKGCSAVEVSK